MGFNFKRRLWNRGGSSEGHRRRGGTRVAARGPWGAVGGGAQCVLAPLCVWLPACCTVRERRAGRWKKKRRERKEKKKGRKKEKGKMEKNPNMEIFRKNKR
jgi:hypothetical protein